MRHVLKDLQSELREAITGWEADLLNGSEASRKSRNVMTGGSRPSPETFSCLAVTEAQFFPHHSTSYLRSFFDINLNLNFNLFREVPGKMSALETLTLTKKEDELAEQLKTITRRLKSVMFGNLTIANTSLGKEIFNEWIFNHNKETKDVDDYFETHTI